MSDGKITLKIEINGRDAEASVARLENEIKRMSDVSIVKLGSVGGAVGGFVGGIVDNLTSRLSEVPQLISSYLDTAVRLAQEKLNALKGLDSIAIFKGMDTQAAQDAAKNLRLVKAGIIELGDGVTGLKNLIASGFSLPQAIKLMERFSDSAAFGKQAALSYGDAVRSATEGIKNQNSILVDNAGVTKNISVILKERGFEMQDLSDKQKSHNALEALYKGLLQETAAQVGDADKLMQGYTGTVAGLDTAYKNLTTSVGEFITTNPDLIAANQIQKEQVQSLTDDLNKQGSETQKLVSDWTSMYARIKAITLPFIAFMKNAVMTGIYTLAGLGLGIVGTFEAAVEGIVTALLGGIHAVYAPVKTLYDNIQEMIGGDSRLPDFKWNYVGDGSFKVFETAGDAFKDAAASIMKGVKSLDEVSATWNDVTTYSRGVIEDQKKIKENLKNTKKEDDRSIVNNAEKAKKSRQNSVLSEMQDYARDQGFVPGSGYRGGKQINDGSLHGSRRALDASVSANASKTVEDWTRYVVGAMEKGWRVIDERIVGFFPGIRSTGPNVHIEKGQGVKSSLFLPQQYYSVPVEYLKYLDEQRRNRKGTGGVSQDDLNRFRGKQSDDETEKARKERAEDALRMLRSGGIMPDSDVISDIIRTIQDNAKKAGQAVPFSDDIKKALEKQARNLDGGEGLPDLTQAKTITELYRERYNLDEREGEYLLRKLHLEKEISARQEDYVQSLKDAQLDIEVEYRLLSQRNLTLEAGIKFGQQQNDQYRQLRDLEVDLDVLRRQNADNQFVEQRRLLASKREQYDLERSISELQDQIASGGKNDALKIYEAHLRDILDLRNRETEAVIATNRAQLELANSMTISNNQIRAGVYEHLAQQKTLNQGMADGINGTYDAVLKKLNSGLDKLQEKTKGFLSFLIEPAKAIRSNWLSNITTSIVDSIFPADSPIAKSLKSTGNPLLDESKQQTSYLRDIRNAVAGNSVSGSSLPGMSGGNGWGNILQWAMGAASGGGNLGNRNGINNPNILNYSTAESDLDFGGNSGGGLFGNLRNLFSTKDGGLFAARPNLLNGGKTSKMGGILGGIGDIASMIGGMIGGRWGGAISMAGQGMSIGSMFGPWGAAIGGAAGFLFGLFSNSQRKKDEKTRTQGYMSATAELDKIIEALNKRPPTMSAANAETQEAEIIRQYQEAMSQLKDKKTRNIALGEITNTNGIIYLKKQQVDAAIKAAKLYEAKTAAAQDLYSRIVPEFASGVYMDAGFRSQYQDFKRYNGMMPGAYTGRDYIGAWIGDGEIVANEIQMNRMRRAAGFDVIAYAGLPNYPSPPTNAPPRFAGGVSFAAPVASSSAAPVVNFEPVMNFYMQRDDSGDWAMYLDTKDGRKKVGKIVEDGVSNGDIKFVKR